MLHSRAVGYATPAAAPNTLQILEVDTLNGQAGKRPCIYNASHVTATNGQHHGHEPTTYEWHDVRGSPGKAIPPDRLVLLNHRCIPCPASLGEMIISNSWLSLAWRARSHSEWSSRGAIKWNTRTSFGEEGRERIYEAYTSQSQICGRSISWRPMLSWSLEEDG